MLRDGCSLEEFKSFILLWRLYAECHDGKDDRELKQQLLHCLDGPLEAALYDAIGYHNINNIPEADILEELGKLAVEENLAMGVIIDVVDNYPTVISEENPVNQQTVQSSQVTDHRSPAHRNTAHSSQDKQPPAKFKPPDHAQAVVTLGLPREDKHGHAAGGGAEKVGLYKIPARRPAQTWHQKTSTELAQEAFQTEKKPPDITMIGLSGGREPDLQVGGHHHGLQVGVRDHHQHVGVRDHDLQVGGGDPVLQMGERDHSPHEKEQDVVQHKMPTDQGELTHDKLRDKETQVVSEFVTVHEKQEQELNIDKEITETSPKKRQNMRKDDNYNLFEKHNSFVKPHQTEDNLNEIPNVDEELLAEHNEAKVEPDAAELLDAEDSDQVLTAEDDVPIYAAEHSDQVLAAEVAAEVLAAEVLDEENLPKHKPVDEEDTVPEDEAQDLAQDEDLGHQAIQDLNQDDTLEQKASQDLALDETRGDQESYNLTYSGGNHILAAEDQALAAEDQFQTEEKVQHVYSAQRDLVAEDSPLAREVQQIQTIQQVLQQQDLVAEDSPLAREIQTIQQDLVAEDLATQAVQHDLPTQEILVAEDKGLAKEVQQVVAAEVQVENAESSDKVLDEDLGNEESQTLTCSGGDSILAYTGGSSILASEDKVVADEIAEELFAAENSTEYKHVDERDTVPIDKVKILTNGHGLGNQATPTLAWEEDPGSQAPEENDCDNDPPAGGVSPLDDGGGDKAVVNDGGTTFPEEEEDPELRKPLKLFLITGMITMLLLMTTYTMTPMLGEYNMKVMSLTGGLHNILRYETINRPFGGEITFKIQNDGVINKKMVNREYVKPPDDNNAPVDKDEKEDVPKPSLDVDKIEQIHNKVNLHLPSKQLVKQDHPVEAHAEVRDGVHDAHVDGAQDAKEFYDTVDDWPDDQAGEVRDDVHTAGGDIQAKEADDDEDHDDTNAKLVVGPEVPNPGEADDTSIEAKKAIAAHDDIYETVVMGPEVPKDDEGGEDDPVQRIVETRGRRSKMTQQGLFANQYRTKLFKAMHESTCQEELQNKTYQRNRSCAKTHHWMSTMHENTDKRDVQYEAYQEEGSSAKNVMRNTLHHPRDCQNQTMSPALTKMGASRGHGNGEDQEDRLHHGGRGGHN